MVLFSFCINCHRFTRPFSKLDPIKKLRYQKAICKNFLGIELQRGSFIQFNYVLVAALTI